MYGNHARHPLPIATGTPSPVPSRYPRVEFSTSTLATTRKPVATARAGHEVHDAVTLRSSALGMRRRCPSRASVNRRRHCSEPIRSRDRQSEWPEEYEDMPRWPENPDDPVDPAIAPLIEAGEGEAEGFDVAEADLIRHAEHGDQHGTDPSGGTPRASERKRSGTRRRPLRRGRRRGPGNLTVVTLSRSWRRGRSRRDPSIETDPMSIRSAIEACVVDVIGAPTSASHPAHHA